MNKYAYSRNNPINLYDPGGEMFGFIGRKYIARQAVKYAFSNPVGATHSATSMVPYIGDAMDIGEVVSGKNAFTGEQLSTGERVVTGVAALLPIVGGAMVRNVGGEVIEATLKRLAGSGDSVLKPTQDWLIPNKVQEYSEILKNGGEVSPIHTLMRGDGTEVILDGHHRYIGGEIAGVEVPKIQHGQGDLSGGDWSDIQFIDKIY